MKWRKRVFLTLRHRPRPSVQYTRNCSNNTECCLQELFKKVNPKTVQSIIQSNRVIADTDSWITALCTVARIANVRHSHSISTYCCFYNFPTDIYKFTWIGLYSISLLWNLAKHVKKLYI